MYIACTVYLCMNLHVYLQKTRYKHIKKKLFFSQFYFTVLNLFAAELWVHA